MPKLIYTAAKGLYESNEGSGVSISDVALAQKATTVEMAAPIYTITLADNSSTEWKQLHDVLLSLYDTDGTQRKILLKRDSGGSFDVEATGGQQQTVTTSGDWASGTTAVTIAHNIAGAALIEDIAQAIVGLDSNKSFCYTVATGTGPWVVKIYSLDNGRLASDKATLMAVEGTASAGAGIQTGDYNGALTNPAFASGDIALSVTSRGQTGGASAAVAAAQNSCTSYVFTSSTGHDPSSMLKANGGGATSTNEYQNTFTLANPGADREGQRVLLCNRNSERYVSVTGASAIVNGGTKVTIPPGKVAHLIWTGAHWERMPTETSGLTYA